ncbi:MAG: dienelactone hydrolase-related enzyme [Gammaproteobacteria bacterium]|jgi:dienelactone hydrolase|nr:dienelactone hydrolase-related enzyme [Gammaproteobacteria bacterium]
MKQHTIYYADENQPLVGQLFFDETTVEKKPGIIVFPAFEGLSEFALDYAKNIAAQGYVALAADIYGDGKTSETIDGCFSLITPFLKDRALVRRRAGLAFDLLTSQEIVDPEKIGAIGFCFGGMCALEVARSGANIKAIVSAHGILTKSDIPNESINGSLLILHGYQDPQVPPEALAPFAREMSAENVADWRFLFFGQGKHSFTDPKTGTFDSEQEAEMGREYNQIAANATWRYAIDFFEEKLKTDA